MSGLAHISLPVMGALQAQEEADVFYSNFPVPLELYLFVGLLFLSLLGILVFSCINLR